MGEFLVSDVPMTGLLQGAAGVALALLSAVSTTPPDWDQALIWSAKAHRGWLRMITFDQMDEAAVERLPLVSCILPTRNRSQLLRRAIQYYDRQTYPNRELLILEDGDEDMTAELAERLLYITCAAIRY